MQDQIVAETSAYFIVHQYKNDDGSSGAEVLERLTSDSETEFDDAFSNLEYEMSPHEYEDRYCVVKVEAKLIKSYVWDYNCYEYDEELYIKEVNFDL